MSDFKAKYTKFDFGWGSIKEGNGREKRRLERQGRADGQVGPVLT